MALKKKKRGEKNYIIFTKHEQSSTLQLSKQYPSGAWSAVTWRPDSLSRDVEMILLAHTPFVSLPGTPSHERALGQGALASRKCECFQALARAGVLELQMQH